MEDILQVYGFYKRKERGYTSLQHRSDDPKYQHISLLKRKGQYQMYLGGWGGKKYCLVVEDADHFERLIKELTLTKGRRVY